MRNAAWLTTATLILGCAQGGPAGEPLVDVAAPLPPPAAPDAGPAGAGPCDPSIAAAEGTAIADAGACPGIVPAAASCAADITICSGVRPGMDGPQGDSASSRNQRRTWLRRPLLPSRGRGPAAGQLPVRPEDLRIHLQGGARHRRPPAGGRVRQLARLGPVAASGVRLPRPRRRPPQRAERGHAPRGPRWRRDPPPGRRTRSYSAERMSTRVSP